MTLFSTSVHDVGLKCIVFLTFCGVAKLALDKIRFKKSLYFPYYFTIFPILALYFWKIATILSPIFLLKATWSPEFESRKICVAGYQCDNGEFKIRRLRTTTTDKHATAHDQNHVTVHFSRVVLRLRWVVELFRVVATTENILLVFCRPVTQESHLFVKKFSIHLL